MRAWALVLSYLLLVSAAHAEIAAAGKRVSAVDVHLPSGLESSALSSLLSVHPGDLLNPKEVRRSIERLFATGRFSDIVVSAHSTPNGVRVVFELQPKRSLGAIRVGGNRMLATSELLRASKLVEGEEFYPEKLRIAIEGVQRAYGERGYRNAKALAELSEQTGAVDVLIRVEEGGPTLLQSISVAGSPALPLDRILEVVGLKMGSVLDLKQLNAGLERLRERYRAEGYYGARVGEPVVTAQGTNGASLQLPLSAGPKYTFHFHGNRTFPDFSLQQVLHYDGSETLDRALLSRLSRRLETFYRYSGFHDVRIWTEEVHSPDESLAVLAFDIDEGQRIRVGRIEFRGNQGLSSELLKTLVVSQIREHEPLEMQTRLLDDPLNAEGRTRVQRSELAPLAPSEILIEEAYPDAADAMASAYREHGYALAQARLDEVELNTDRGEAVVRFSVDEGPQTFIQRVQLRGAPPALDSLNALLPRVGAPLSKSVLDQTRSQLLNALAHSGYLFAKVEADSTLSQDGKTAEVLYRVAPGPQVRVGQVIVQGLTRTDESWVRTQLKVRSGAVLNPEDLFQSQRSLIVVGAFRQVAVRLISPETQEAVKDVVVELKERNRLSGEVGVGYFLVDGPRIIGDAVYPNVFGKGINLSARAKLNYFGASALVLNRTAGFDITDLQGLDGLGGQGNIALVQPRIYSFAPLEMGARLDFIAERVVRPSYRFTRFATIVGLDWAATRWLNATLQYELEYDRVRAPAGIQDLLPSLARTDQERLRFGPGIFALQTLRPAFTIDFRDDPANPQSGMLFSTTTELTKDIYATRTDPLGRVFLENGRDVARFPVFTLKVSGNLSVYVPVYPRVVLALSARAGKIFSLIPRSQTIAPKRFYLGGSTSMRGFHEDGLLPSDRRAELHDQRARCDALANSAGCTAAAQALAAGSEIPSEGGELFTLGKAELRFPLAGGFDVGVFGEAGNLWADASRFDLGDLRYVAGFGIRYGTPIGPLALDLGFNLVPDYRVNEQAFNLNFSIGVF